MYKYILERIMDCDASFHRLSRLGAPLKDLLEMRIVFTPKPLLETFVSAVRLWISKTEESVRFAGFGFRGERREIAGEIPLLSLKCSRRMKGHSGCFWKLNDGVMIIVVLSLEGEWELTD